MRDVISGERTWIDELADRFEEEWRHGGGRPRIENYLDGQSGAARASLLTELLRMERELREDAGEKPSAQEYLDRFPEDRAAVHAAFEVPDQPASPPRKPAASSAQSLLFGLLALQNNFIDRDTLLAAFNAWVADKSQSLGQILLDRGAISPARHAALDLLVQEHLQQHGCDPERSLAVLKIVPSVRSDLEEVPDLDLHASLLMLGLKGTEGGSEEGEQTASWEDESELADPDGRFRIVRFHDRGALGEVYVARDQQLHRIVALKRIKLDQANSPEKCARFVVEAEITGRLEHPGIVPVYGLGAFDDGRPFYAMRFIRGDNLKSAIEQFHKEEKKGREPGQRNLALQKLLRRFLDVCNAIDYAHSRGVLHRDLKPGNIMLGKFGETLVVDWGLAKTVGRPEAAPAQATMDERTLIPQSGSDLRSTEMGARLGTPAYMSPEQAAGRIDALGPASDVYSLGATLYCLLTGQAPFTDTDMVELLRKAERGDFLPPRKRKGWIAPALEAICLRAMATDPERRYRSPRALADDVEHWLADEPVSAWREPIVDRARRWMRHRRTAVTAAAVALVVATIGLASVLAVQAKANVDLTNANQKVTQSNVDLQAANERVRQRFDLAMEAINLFHSEVSEDLLLKEKQFEGLRARLLKGAAGFYGKLQLLLEGQADRQSRAALGRAYFDLGGLTLEIGTQAESATVHRKGLALRRELAGSRGADDKATIDVVQSLRALAVSLNRTANVQEGRELLEEAIKLAEGLIAAGRGSDEAKFELAECMAYQDSMVDISRPEEEAVAIRRLEMARRALAIGQELVGKNPGETRYLKLLGDWHGKVGRLLGSLGRLAEGMAAQKEAAATYQRLVDAQPEAYQLQNFLAMTRNNITGFLREMGKHDEAVASQHQALAIWRRVADANPAVKSLSNNVAFGLTHLAVCLNETGRPAEALEALAEARPIWQKLADADSSNLTHPKRLANNYLFAGELLVQMGMRREANAAFGKGVANLQKLADEHHSHNGLQSDLASSLGMFGWSLWKGGRAAEAVAAYGRERAIRQGLAAARPATAAGRNELANCETNTAAALLSLGLVSDARACCDRAIAAREDLVKGEPKNDDYAQGLAESLMRSGSVRAAAGDNAGAAADYRHAAALYASHPPQEPQSAICRACCHGALGGLANAAGSGVPAAEGLTQAEEAMAILRKAVADGYRDIDHLRVEPGLDPLRARRDLRLLMMDLAFPAEPFVR
jgi:serine/threonine-protein kinase